jgi:flagellar M-ring protein FliF
MADAQVVATQGKIPGLRPLMLLIGIATAVAAGVAVMLWWQGPNWSLLYANLESADAGQVTQALTTAGIKYKISDANGAIMVPADKVSEARLQLASQGLPGSSGIEMISKETGLGVSQFMETARYQYAVEQELGRTIASLRNVEAARVHLAIPQQSAFVRDRRSATASVLVQVKQGSRLEDGQVQAIVHLVASSIPELDSKQVTIVDQQGRLLSSPDQTGSGAISNENLEATRRLEESYVQRIEQLLIPLVGVGRVRAQVAVDLDAATVEQTHEQYAPNSSIVRTEQTSEATSKGAAGATGGVPGSLTNQPPAGGALASAANATPPPAASAAAATGAAATAAAAAAAAAVPPGTVVAPDNVTKQASRSYEIDRTLSYNKQPGGRVKRVTVAVLLDNAHKLGADGKETTEALPAAQIEDITRLVKNAVGFDEARGDSVGVVNAAFREDKQELTPEVTPVWQKPWVQDIARLALGALVLLALALGVLRPMIRNLTAQVVSPAAATPALAGAAAGAAGGGADAGGQAALGAPRSTMQLEQQIADAKSMLAQDPKRAAQVVKTWVGER